MGFFRKCGEMRRIRLNSRARKAFLGRSRGFTLIEVVVAVALLGIIGVTVLSGLSTAAASLILADRRATAESLARSQMEYVKNQGYVNATSPTWQVTYSKISLPGVTDVAGGYSICSCNDAGQAVNCTASEGIIAIALNSTTSDSGLQKITLVIKHGDEEIITLEGYKRRRGG
jgi:prepilin-type N-terminal cleavage/methylation domain-containing protein